ncbi:MAG: cupin domain-containing protein [Steroidobacteraceae bacterium]
MSGGCWLVVEGSGDPVRLEAGDCFVLPSGRPSALVVASRGLRPRPPRYFRPREGVASSASTAGAECLSLEAALVSAAITPTCCLVCSR